MKGKVYSYKTKNKGLQWGFVHDAPISTKKRNQIRKTGQSTEKEASSVMRKSISDYEAGKLELSDMKVADVIQLYLDYAKNEGKREKGYIQGTDEGKLVPKNKITRAEAVTLLSRVTN